MKTILFFFVKKSFQGLVSLGREKIDTKAERDALAEKIYIDKKAQIVGIFSKALGKLNDQLDRIDGE